MEVLPIEKKLIKIIRSCSTKKHIDCARICVDNAIDGKYITKEVGDRVKMAFDNKNDKIMGECYEL